MRVSIAFLCFVCVSGVVDAHSGRTNSEGCHAERSTGTRHCHVGHSPAQVESRNREAEYGYDRRTFMNGWDDEDGDCQDARQEVLIAESLERVVLDDSGCRVVSGLWYDPYTDDYFRNPSDLDIDHMVPLEEAYDSGAKNWNHEKRRAYANNLENPDVLIAVSLSANRSKGSRDPAEWMPDNHNYHCQYLEAWIGVKSRYDLDMDERELNYIANKIRECE